MFTQREELWLPRQGSWEEAVDPYDVQVSRVLARMEARVTRENKIKRVPKQQMKYNSSTSA
jgi:hypothetical protein